MGRAGGIGIAPDRVGVEIFMAWLQENG
jgi:hypothetical protein